MSDEDFESFLENSGEEEIQEDPNYKRGLLLDSIKQKIESTTDIYSSSLQFLTEIKEGAVIKEKTRILVEDLIPDLIVNFKNAMGQFDYLISRFMDELYDNGKELK